MDFYLATGRNGKDDYCWIVWRDGAEFRYFDPSEDNFAHTRPCPTTSEPTEKMLASAMDGLYPNRAPFRLTKRKLPPGCYHPRIRRGVLIRNEIKYGLPTLDVDAMGLRQALVSSASAAGILFHKLKSAFEVVEPNKNHESVYGNELRHLLILACTEVESAWRSILVANHHASENSLSTREYVKLLEPMQLDQWRVRLARSHDSWTFAPFENWDVSKPTQSLPWYDSYNATKHDRETHLNHATLKNVLNAMSAVYILLVSQFGTEEILNYGLDDFVIKGMPETENIDAYILNYRTDVAQDHTWRSMPLFT